MRAAVILGLCAVLAGLLSAGRGSQHAPRRVQYELRQLETTPGASADWFRVLSRDDATCSFEQGVRSGTPGFNPQASWVQDPCPVPACAGPACTGPSRTPRGGRGLQLGLHATNPFQHVLVRAGPAQWHAPGAHAARHAPQFPGSPPPHRHTHSDETFTVLKGTMGYSVDGQLGIAAEGENVTIPKGALRRGVLLPPPWRFSTVHCSLAAGVWPL